MPEAEVIAYHGWGFDSFCWNQWQEMFGDGIAFKSYERGYFGKAERAPVFMEKKVQKIVMAHSFGLHFCPEIHFSKADLVIIFGGFIQFHPVAAQYRRRSRLVLNQMVNNMKEKPEKVLDEFYKNSFSPQEAPKFSKKDLQKEKLLKDLQLMDTHKIEAGMLKKADKLCILHGSRDAIIHRRKGRELYESFSKKSQYFEIKNAGHALPFTHGKQCWQFIEPELTELISR